MGNLKNRILVVDDEPEIVSTLSDFLSLKGYVVTSAYNGEEALQIMERQKEDIILLDLRMPGIQGEEVAKIIKEKYPTTKIIIVTGYAEETNNLVKAKILEEVFTKPVRLQELYNKLLEVSESTDAKSKQGIEARVLLIKAKLLFIEQSGAIYSFLNSYFKGLAKRGEDYELESALDEPNIIEKLVFFKPDILVVNSNFLTESKSNILAKIVEKNLCPKEIIIYNIGCGNNFSKDQLQKLTKSVEIACLKNGLIDVKWIEI